MQKYNLHQKIFNKLQMVNSNENHITHYTFFHHSYYLVINGAC